MNSKQINFYELLELAPDVTDELSVKEAIKSKQREWARLANHPTKGMQAKRYRELLPEIEKVMSDPLLREKESKEFKLVLDAKNIAKRKDVFRRIQLLSAKGYLLEDEVSALNKEFMGTLREDELRRHIKCPIRKIEEAQIDARESLDVGTAKKLEEQFKMIPDHDDLYSLLGVSRKSDPTALKSRATEQYEVLLSKGISAENDARSGLLALAQVIFLSPEQKARYDRYLELRDYKKLDLLIETIGTIKKSLLLVEVEELLKEARRYSLHLEEARRYIADYARKKNWLIEMPLAGQAAAVSYLQCGECSELNVPDPKLGQSQRCQHCGQTLWHKCPRCNYHSLASLVACSSCGLTLGNLFEVRRLLRDSDLALARGQRSEALGLARQALVLWPDHADALKTINNLEQHEKDLCTRLLSAEQHVRIKQFYAARATLQQLKREHQNQDVMLLDEKVERQLTQVENLLQKSKKHEHLGQLEQALDSYLEILRLCSDCQPAQEGAAKCPPAPPGPLSVKIQGASACLSWLSAPSKYALKYQVVRKIGSPPSCKDDGHLFAETSTLGFNDTEGIPGVPLYYAVFSSREGVASDIGSHAPHAVFLTRPVEQFAAVPGDRTVHLSWQSPPNCVGIGLSRTDRFGKESQLLSELGGAYQDRDVANEQPYRYKIAAMFRDLQGALIFSAPSEQTVIPKPLPSPPQELQIKSSRLGQVEISWQPSTDPITVLKTTQKPTLLAGQSFSARELHLLGLPLPNSSPHTASDQIEQFGVCYYTPFASNGSVFVSGQPQEYTCIDDVTEIHANHRGDVIEVQWAWPSLCKAAHVSYCASRPPNGHDDPQAIHQVCPRAQYEQAGCFTIPSHPQHDCFIAVYAVVQHGDRALYSSGLTPTAHVRVRLRTAIRISYRITKQKRFGLFTEGYQLQIHSEQLSACPPLVLVGKFGSLPSSPNNGEVVLDMDTRRLSSVGNNGSLPIPKAYYTNNYFVRLFPLNESDYERLTICHPKPEQLKLAAL